MASSGEAAEVRHGTFRSRQAWRELQILRELQDLSEEAVSAMAKMQLGATEVCTAMR